VHKRCFDHIFVVFDRDQHRSYHDALKQANSHDQKHKNDEGQKVRFKAIASVPCFELWLLLHYEDVQAPIARAEVISRLRNHLRDYEKGMTNTYALTERHLWIAKKRAAFLSERNSAHTDPEPYTGMGELVTLLTTLRAN
jgi:hypothetical protein